MKLRNYILSFTTMLHPWGFKFVLQGLLGRVALLLFGLYCSYVTLSCKFLCILCLLIYIFLCQQVLLRADKSSANFSDKSLLKNLGHWLGMLTLGKSRPILHNDIDVKSLVIEAYSKGLQVSSLRFLFLSFNGIMVIKF